MKIDKSDFYPYTPGSSCDPESTPEEMEISAPEKETEKDTADVSDLQNEEEEEIESPRNDKPGRSEIDAPSVWNEMFTRLSNVISWVLVPMLVTVWATMMIFGLSSLDSVPSGAKTIFTLIVFGFTAVIPMGLVLLLKSMKVIDDIGLNGRKERFIPYLIMIASYFGTAVFFWVKGAPSWMWLFYVGGGVAAIINMFINFSWKISAHSTAMAGVVAMLLVINRDGLPHVDLTWWMVGTVVLTGLLGTARIWLGRHTLGQVMAGYAVGFASVYLISFIPV